MWLNGNQARTTDHSLWTFGQPRKNNKRENCGMMIYTFSKRGELLVDDFDCTRILRGICEKLIV